MENQNNLASHSYYIILNIKELNQVSRKYSRKIKIVNIYDNQIGKRYIWQGFSSIIQYTIQDIFSRSII